MVHLIMHRGGGMFYPLCLWKEVRSGHDLYCALRGRGYIFAVIHYIRVKNAENYRKFSAFKDFLILISGLISRS